MKRSLPTLIAAVLLAPALLLAGCSGDDDTPAEGSSAAPAAGPGTPVATDDAGNITYPCRVKGTISGAAKAKVADSGVVVVQAGDSGIEAIYTLSVKAGLLNIYVGDGEAKPSSLLWQSDGKQSVSSDDPDGLSANTDGTAASLSGTTVSGPAGKVSFDLAFTCSG